MAMRMCMESFPKTAEAFEESTDKRTICARAPAQQPRRHHRNAALSANHAIRQHQALVRAELIRPQTAINIRDST